MKILAIETSCDDTCAAVLEIRDGKIKILSNIVSSQVKLHAKYGGVFPFLAKREHQRNLPIVLRKALKRANFSISNFQPAPHRTCSGAGFPISKKIPNPKIKIPKMDLVAVTVGPGLEPCLWTGINFAIDLAKRWELPIIPVNHIEAHIMANWLTSNIELRTSNKIFPAVCLVVSGGHTQLILMNKYGDYKILGETRDDAAGECLDKAARILGLAYPGGPAIAEQAAQWKYQIPSTKFQTPKESLRDPTEQVNSKFQTQHQSESRCWTSPAPKRSFWCGVPNSKPEIHLPRPMIRQKNYDFSFSGLKTAVLYDFINRSLKIRKSNAYITMMCREIQQAIIDVLVHKTLKAAKDYKAKTIILGGGVAANNELRKQFRDRIKKTPSNIQYLIPNIQFCTDNAAMTGITGYFHWQKKEISSWEKIKAEANLRMEEYSK